MYRILLIFGTRPEAIKMAPVIQQLSRTDGFETIVAVTAQHRDLLDQVLDLFKISPAYDLDILKARQSLTDITTRALSGLVEVVRRENPDFLAVHGDTTTTFAGALAGFYARIPVAHVEAGLRTGDRSAPYPEEMNRRLVSQLADVHFAPTGAARTNLLGEGISPESVYVTGNTVIDALHWAVHQRTPMVNSDLRTLDGDPRPVVLVTAHRRETWGEGMRSIGAALKQLASEYAGVLFVFPVHPNPAVRESIGPAVEGIENIWLSEPLPYGEFAYLMDKSTIVLTDSGGIQEEAPSLGKPVLVMRDTTERPEAIQAGTARLVGTSQTRIVQEVRRLLNDPVCYEAMANAVNPYGDGRAAGRIVAGFEHLLKGGPRPKPFTA